MALTFGVQQQITSDVEVEGAAYFVYGPDRSAYFLFNVDSPPVNAASLGLFLTKRKRDGTLLPPQRVDFISGDSENIDYLVSPWTNRPLSAHVGVNSCIDIDQFGNVHCAWKQTGRGGSGTSGLCYRMFTYDGNDDSYGTPGPVRYFNPGGGGLLNALAMSVNKVDGTVWFVYTKSNQPTSIWTSPGDAEGALGSSREKTLPWNPSIGGSPICQDTFNMFADPYGNIHVALLNGTAAQWEVNYVMRMLSDPKPGNSAADPHGWSRCELAVGPQGGAPATGRSYVCVQANSESDVLISYTHNTATNKQVFVVTRESGWIPVDVSAGTSILNRYPPALAATNTNGYATVVWFEDNGSAADGLHYAEMRAGVFGAAAQGFYRDASGAKGYSVSNVKFLRMARTPYQLGYQNPLVGRLGVCWLQTEP